MLFLRPKTEATPAPTPAPATAPGVTGLGNAVDKAKDASAASDKANEKLQNGHGRGRRARRRRASPAPSRRTAKRSSPAACCRSSRSPPSRPRACRSRSCSALDNRRGLRGRRLRHQAEALGPHGQRRPRSAPRARQGQPLRRQGRRRELRLGKLSQAQRDRRRRRRDPDPVGRRRRPQPPRPSCSTGFVDRNAINQAIADARRNSIERAHQGPLRPQPQRDLRELRRPRLDRFNVPTTRAEIKPGRCAASSA